MNTLLRQKRKIAPILQAQASECGLACLAMIANYHGHSIDLAFMRSMLPVSRRGSSFADIADVANRLGFDARGFALSSVEDLANVALPAVLHWDGNHFIVLESIKRGSYIVHDPAFGTERISIEDMRQHFSGVVLEIERRMDFKGLRNARGSLFWPILKSADGLASAFAVLILLSFAISVLALMSPILLQVALDIVLPQYDLDLLSLLCIGLGMFMVFEAAGKWLRDLVVLRSSSLFQAMFTRNVVGHAFRLPMKYFEQRHPGDFIARLDSINMVKATLVDGVVTSIADSAMAILIVAMMLYYSPTMTFIVVGTMAGLLIMRFGFLPRVKAFSATSLKAHSNERERLLDGLRQMEAVKVHNASPRILARWYDSLIGFVNAEYFAKRLEILMEFLLHIAFAVSTVITIYIGVLGVMKSEITLGILYAFFFLRQMFFERMDRVSTQLMHLAVLGVHFNRVDDIIGEEPEAGVDEPGIDRVVRKFVTLKDITVQFAERDAPIISGANLTIDIAKGEAIAIAGPSGSGKSSLLKIIASLHGPHAGQILVDGRPLSSFGLREYRANIGAVFADDGLSLGTVAENITMFDPGVSAEDIAAAVASVGLEEVVAALPQGLNTLVADESGLLSTGQRRRLLAARAICKRPPLVLFDEITANLDPETEQSLIDGLLKVKGSKIFVTHSPRLLARMDKTYRITADGRLERMAEDVLA